MYWRPPATGPPTPSRNGGSIFCKRPAVAVEHDAGAHLHHAHPQLRGSCGLELPVRADVRQEVASRPARPRRAAPRRAVRSSRSPRRSGACAGGARRRAGPRRDGGCPSRGSRGSPPSPSTSSAGRRSRPRGARRRRARPAPRPAPARSSGPTAPPPPAPAAARRVEPSRGRGRGRARGRSPARRDPAGRRRVPADQPCRSRDGHAQGAHPLSFSHARLAVAV